MFTRVADQIDQAGRLRELHRVGMLVLPNVWDAGSAAVVVDAGFPVVATSSAAIAAMLGYPDGERAPWTEMFAAAGRIAASVAVPVTVDAEAGYGLEPRALVDGLLDLGAVGCNLEDTDHRAGGLVDAGAHTEWLAAVRVAADDSGVPLVLNARIDTYLPDSGIDVHHRAAETIRRGRMYRAAGADCVYPIGIPTSADVAAVVGAVESPLNANSLPGLDLDQLRRLGVRRVSFGPRFYRTALADFAASVGRLLLPLGTSA